MRAEIAEQPAVLDRILTEGLEEVRRVAERIRHAAPRFVVLAARGTSDHAALYAKYLIEVLLGLPAGLASPSTTTVYGAPGRFADVLYVAVSQSGESPDLVESLRAAREGGALTLAVTNAASSPLAEGAAFHLDVLAGQERSVAATKTYTAQLLTLYLLVDALRGGDRALGADLPGLAARTLELAAHPAVEVAEHLHHAAWIVCTGRGYSYATAREAALKLVETAYLPAHAYSGADLMHGPLAMLDSGTPVVAVVGEGAGGQALDPVVERLRSMEADVLIAGPGGALPTVTGVPEEVAPVIEIMPLQLLAAELAAVRAIDPDQPRGLAKVTLTR
jgi:glucosamine--fructose-6-phosphate aminotransferase (isomerizing)